jgi:ubiquitin-like protein Pup
MVQINKEKHGTTTEQESMSDAELQAAQKAGEVALNGIDNEDIEQLLDEIDDVLEENAEEFVGCFIQKGGQ